MDKRGFFANTWIVNEDHNRLDEDYTRTDEDYNRMDEDNKKK